MKKNLLLFLVTMFAFCWQVNAQINSGNPAKPFGSNTSYQYGIMPTNLPTSGTYGKSQAAATAYDTWKTAYVEACTGGQYRVKFDTPSETVSEGIAYGMLLSVYAGDKALFDGLWAYYKAKSNNNGVMNWKINGCNNATGTGGATDAELDAAMALIIAAEQWPSATSPYNYKSEAQTLIGKIKQHEMTTAGQTLNGDQWGQTNTCRNPSYISPAYYTQFAKVVTAANDITFWGTTAIDASNTVLTANRHATTGLVSNWCNNNGVENNCNGDLGYGFDSSRNPWRMAVDYLWHGTNASTASKDICAKLTTYVSGNENKMQGPITNRGNNITTGLYRNGTFSTFALPPMTSSSAQSSLNSCYTNVVSLPGNDVYFNATIRCITLFVMTGNFWAPGSGEVVSAPTLVSAATNADGSAITLTFSKTMATPASANGFTLYIGGTAVTSAFTGATVSGQTITLNIAAGKNVVAGNVVTLGYNSATGTIKCTDGQNLASITSFAVENNVPSNNNTVIADCEKRETALCTTWWTYDDGTSTITATKDAEGAILMTEGGAAVGNGYVSVNYNVATSAGAWGVGFGFNLDEKTVGTNKVPVDLTGATGITFWHRGTAGTIQVSTAQYAENFSANVSAHGNTWTQVTVPFSSMYGTYGSNDGVQLTNISAVNAIQFQIASGNGTFSIDHVQLDNINLKLCDTQPCTPPTVSISTNPPITTVLTCTMPSIGLSANGAGVGATYEWSNGATGALINVTSPGIYTVTVTAADGCTATESITITENKTPPTAGITNNTGTTVLTCTMPVISLTATGGGSYDWGAGIPNSANVTVNAAGTYTVTVTALNGCTNTASITIMQDQTPPTAGISNNTGTTELTCTLLSISLTATGGGTYAWNNGLGNNANVNVTSAGTYTVTVTGANGCTDTKSIVITADKGDANANITNNTGTTVLTCTTPSISLTATGNGTYSWSNSLGSNANVTITVPGTYTVTVTESNGCADSKSITITEDKTPPTAGITNNSGTTVLTCTTPSISLTATGGGTYSWDNGLGNGAAVTVTTPSTYTVTVTGSNGCTATSSVTITINKILPIVDITNNTGTTVLTCTTPSISLTATGGGTYAWSNGLGNNANVIISAPGTYTVAVTNMANGCTDTKNITISADPSVLTVNFDSNGGSEVPGKTACPNNTITKPSPDPTRLGYNFADWYLGANIFNFSTPITATITLRAEWNIITYNIVYVLDGGVNHLNNPSTYTVENLRILLQDPTKENYIFLGWSEGNEIPAGSTETKTFTAQWRHITGVTEVSTIAAMQIYPNPAEEGRFNVKLPNSETAVLTIINLQGKAVYSTIIDNGFASINANLGAGVYVVSIQSESGLKTQKLVVK